MLLASTGQPSFYPESDAENKTIDEKEKDKINNDSEKNDNKKDPIDKKSSIDYGEKDVNYENKKSIFDFQMS